MLMAKVPGFASAFAGRRRIVEMDIGLRLRNLAEFFNSLLDEVVLDRVLIPFKADPRHIRDM